jgi:hypothetical protein
VVLGYVLCTFSHSKIVFDHLQAYISPHDILDVFEEETSLLSPLNLMYKFQDYVVDVRDIIDFIELESTDILSMVSEAQWLKFEKYLTYLPMVNLFFMLLGPNVRE